MAKSKPRIRKVSATATTPDKRINALYEGASTGARMGFKGMRVSGPNAEVQAAQLTLIKRSRHALANNPYAISARNTYTDNLVGTGIIPKWPSLELQELWNKWALECDADGHSNFYGLQALLCDAEFAAGECFIRRRWRRTSDGLPVPFQLEIKESEFVPLENNLAQSVIMGIRKNALGQRENYQFWNYHPADFSEGAGNTTKPVAASDVIHYFQRLRPGQDRGIPHLSVILLRLYEIDEMQDATLQRQKLAQLFAWIVTRNSEDLPDETVEGDEGETGEEFGEHIGEDEDGAGISRIKAGAIHYLDDNENIEFSSPGDVGNNYATWLKIELRALAKALGLTYEQLTGDLEGVNYSSIRAGLIEFRRRIERLQHHLMIFKFCHRVAQWFLEHVYLNDIMPLPGFNQDPSQYLPKWRAPRWDWVDPLKDVMADVMEVRGGLSTLKEKCAERGLDYDEVIQQLMTEQGVTTPGELVLDTNPRAVNKSGALQQGSDLLAALGTQ